MTNDLVAKDHFTDLRSQIAKIKEENKSIVFDYEADEKEARSHVATLRKSKTAVNNIHKEKKKFFLEEGRKIDAGKNELISEIDEMIDVHAKPLQEIKDRKDADIELERKKVERDLDWDMALDEDSLFNREREMKRKEDEHAKLEADRIAKEQAEIDRKAQIDYEAKVQKEAEERAVKDHEESLLKEQQEKDFAIQETIRLKKQAQTDLENAEKKRLYDIERAKFVAEEEKRQALAKQKADQEAKEKAELDRIEAERVIAERKAKNLNHVKAVNNKVLKKVAPFCSSEQKAKDLIENLIKEKIIEITINY